MVKTKWQWVVVGVGSLLWSGLLLANPAGDLMQAVSDRYVGDTRTQYGRLTLIDAQKNTRVRVIKEITKAYKEGDKLLSFVVEPADVRGTAFLAYEWDDQRRDDENWLYLPQLKRVKRLATSDQSGYFLGSDFTYADVSGLDMEDFDHRFEQSEADAEGLVIVESVPKSGIYDKIVEKYGYLKVQFWVDIKKKLVKKAKYWLKEGHREKYFLASEIVLKSDIWTVQKMQMLLTQGGNVQHASVYEVNNVVYDLPIGDEEFTTYSLERGMR